MTSVNLVCALTLLAAAAASQVANHERLLVRREQQRLQQTQHATPWWQGAGPAAVTSLVKSNTMLTVFIVGDSGKQLSLTTNGTLKFTDSTGADSRWNFLDSGENGGTIYLQSASGQTAAFAHDTGGGIESQSVPSPFKLEAAPDGKIKIKSSVHGNYLEENGDSHLMASPNGHGAPTAFKVMVVSVGWGRHDFHSRVSPTTVQVYLTGSSGTHFRVESPQSLLLSGTSFGSEETLSMIDAGDGCTYLRSHTGGYLRDNRGTLEISDWGTGGNADAGGNDPAKLWRMVRMPSWKSTQMKFTSKSGRDLMDNNGAPGLSNNDNSLPTAVNKQFTVTLKGADFQLAQ